MPPIQMDGDAELNAEDAFLNHFLPTTEDADAEEPSGEGQGETNESDETEEEVTDEASEQEDAPEDEAEDEDDGEDSADRKYTDDEDTYVKIKVEDKEHEVSVKELKRLWGQEAALTTKSQKVAEQRKTVEAEQQKYATAAQALLERANARWEPFSKVDFVLAAKELSAEDYTEIRNAAQMAYEDVKFLTSEVDAHVKETEQKQHAVLVDQAKETVAALSKSPDEGGIEGWGEKLYDDIRTFGIDQGLDPTLVNNLVDANAIRVLHKAMLYERGKSKIKTTRVNKSPKKVVKTTSNSDATKAITTGSKTKKAEARLLKTGNVDDAADLFLARWSSDEG